LNTYTPGTEIELTSNILQSSNNQPLNAGSIVCKVMNPDASITNLDNVTTNPSTGQYVAPFLVAQTGLHLYEFIGTAPAQVAQIGKFMGGPQTF
jgi:hypothetical protein